MQGRTKKLAISTTAVVVVLSVLALAKYFNAGLAFAVDNSCRLAAALPNLTNLSEHLNTGQYRSFFENISLVAFLLLLALWRTLFLKKQQ